MKYLFILLLLTGCTSKEAYNFYRADHRTSRHYNQRQRINARDRARLRSLYTPSWLDHL